MIFILPVWWIEKGLLDTSTTGRKPLFSQHGALGDIVRWYIVKKKPTLGNSYNNYDNVIIEKASKYGIPPALLKSLIYKETQSDPFSSKTYRYEPSIDYYSFSGNFGGTYTRITSYPFKHFALPGKNSNGQNIAKGDQVDSLNPSYATIIKSFAASGEGKGWSLRSIILTDRNGDGILTAKELYDNDWEKAGGSQKWPELPDYTFTPQLLLASSYGLGHVLYREAILTAEDPNGNLWFDISTTGLARKIYEMTELETSVELTASMLKTKFNRFGPSPGDNCNSWGLAVERYNGTTAESVVYRQAVCKMYYSDHLFDPQ